MPPEPEYRPAGHSVTADAPSPQYPPAVPQFKQSVEPPLGWYVPAAHLVHAVAPGAGVELPGSHRVHGMVPGVSLYLPVGQS